MAKKSKTEARMRKKDNMKSQSLNPFEIRHKKSKHKVVGVKEKTVGGLPGVSRSRAIEKRQNTLGVEYKKRMKKNKFVDERFGANDANLTPEEKMLKRFAIERQKRHSKQAVYDLEEDVLTHKGVAIDQMDTFDDVYSSDSDDDGRLDDATTDLHFGGFLTKNEGKQTHERSGKDVLDDIVARSKLEKLEKQRHKEEASEATLKLDDDWNSLKSLLSQTVKPIKSKKNTDEFYDKAVRELAFESKAAPTDRLKTDEEIARENRDELERLEKERQERMQEGGNGMRTENSADALLKVKRKEKPGKVMVSYDKESGKMNKNKEFSSALAALKEKNANKSDSEDEDTSDSESEAEDNEEGDEDEETGGVSEEEEEDEGDVEVDSDDEDNDDKALDRLPQLISNNIEDDDNCVFDDIVAESDEDNDSAEEAKTNLDHTNDTIPYILDTPEHLKDFNALIIDLEEKDVVLIIKRIIASNHPTLKEENKEKSFTFYIIIIKYLISKYSDRKLTVNLLDSILAQLFSVTKFISLQIYHHVFGIVTNLKHLIQKNRGKSLSVIFSQRYVMYLYLIERIYPVTDFKHAVVTPMLLSVTMALSTSSIRKLSDVKVGIFLSNFILNSTKTTRRYSSELIYFLTQITKRIAGHQQEYVTNFKIKPKTLLSEGYRRQPVKLDINGLYDNDVNSPVDVFFALLQTISSSMKHYRENTAFDAVFYDMSVALSEVKVEGMCKEITDIISSILQQYRQFGCKILPYLRYDNIKPTSIKLYEPKFDMVFMERRRKDKDETQRLKKKVRSELKGAVSEIRKDNKFMSRMKHNEQAAKDATRKRKVNEIMGFLSKEQGEANDLKWKKKRGKA